MADESVVRELREHSFVAALPAQHVETLAALAKRVHFDGRQIILGQGEESSQLYLISSGRVALEIAGWDQPFVVDTLGAGDEFGWSWALGNPGVYQVRSLEPVEALVFQGSDLLDLCDSDPVFGHRLMRQLLGVVAERLQATRVQLIDTYWPVARRAGA
jgi:CRP-like cAMP-binding protein